MSKQIFQTLQRDPRVSPLANNGQARITTLDDENARIELAGELSTFVCDGQYGQAMERILQSYLAQQGGLPKRSLGGGFLRERQVASTEDARPPLGQHRCKLSVPAI